MSLRSSGLRSPLEFRGVGHRAGAAAGAAERNQDFLLFFLIEIAAVEHLPGLLFKQLVQQWSGIGDLLIGWRLLFCGDRAWHCAYRFSLRFLPFAHAAFVSWPTRNIQCSFNER